MPCLIDTNVLIEALAGDATGDALERIKAAIAQVPERHIEVVKIEVPVAESLYRQNGQLGETEGNPLLQWAGAFRNDPTWDAMFDEIERQRDATLVRE